MRPRTTSAVALWPSIIRYSLYIHSRPQCKAVVVGRYAMDPFMKKLFLLICTLFHLLVFGQEDSGKGLFNVKVADVSGYLNNDQFPDKVLVMQDTTDGTAPYCLQIFFADKAGHLKMHLSTRKPIEPEYPNGREGYLAGTKFSEVTIKRRVLTISHELTRGHYEHKYRYQNRSFELIGFSMVNSDGHDQITTIDFNLSTGIRTEKIERYDIDKVISFSKKKVLVRPLPKLEDLTPFEGDLY
jgi:hypothetical protein